MRFMTAGVGLAWNTLEARVVTQFSRYSVSIGKGRLLTLGVTIVI